MKIITHQLSEGLQPQACQGFGSAQTDLQSQRARQSSLVRGTKNKRLVTTGFDFFAIPSAKALPSATLDKDQLAKISLPSTKTPLGKGSGHHLFFF